MKKTIVFLMCFLMVSTVLAVGEYADESIKTDDIQVRDQTWAEKWFGGWLFEIGTYNQEGSFTTTFYDNEKVTLKFDETSWNLQCDGAKFVIEVYNPTGFEEALYSWIGPIDGKEHKVATLTYDRVDTFGTWHFVDYMWCTDTSSIISSTNSIKIKMLDSSSTETCDEGFVGSAICSNGDVKKSYRLTDCSIELRLIDKCGDDQHCNAAKCHDPECTVDSDCSECQECSSEGCSYIEGCTVEESDSGESGEDGSSEDGSGDGSGEDGSSDDDDSGTTDFSIWYVVGGIGLVLIIMGLITMMSTGKKRR